MKAVVGQYPVYFWLVYDKTPGRGLPVVGTIFDTTYSTLPCTWMVQRAVCHRFVVKKHWSMKLESNGVEVLKKGERPMLGPVHNAGSCVKFHKRLGVSTEWKNSASGDVGDIKEGALYFICAPSLGSNVVITGKFRVYFKSVGNQ